MFMTHLYGQVVSSLWVMFGDRCDLDMGQDRGTAARLKLVDS